MKSFVIAIDGHDKSQQASDRCIKSGKLHGLSVEKFSAITPKDDVYKICASFGIDTSNFSDFYSRLENSIACLLSHYSLWNTCIDLNEPIAIFEHDAVITSPLPATPPNFVGNIGHPSFGRFNTPSTIGWGKLVSKPYFPGCHAYIVTPMGARLLTEKAKKEARTPDIYLDTRRFSWLQEHYPYCAYADDRFTTIQHKRGCAAKHNNDKGYEILEV
jgi:GR25 family glycosyltransferase involved in LPS biosynthesis